MNVTAQTQTKPESTPTFTPIHTKFLQRKCACGGTPGPDGECAKCRGKRLALQHRATEYAETSSVPPIVHEVLRSPGQPLDPTTRSFMEPRFGHDFGGVRVHKDAKAAESARAVNALAYVAGQNAVFGAGQYAPGSGTGQRLLAHELAHVVQQGRPGGPAASHANLEVSNAGDTAEQEAETLADRILTAGEEQTGKAQIGLQQIPAGTLQRTPAPPTHGGVTGVRDLTRIRIDAVPDFLASSFTAPLDVNVQVADATVTHLTWLLYDPSDNMMPGSYSTLPGFPDSTTRPFRLEPSHFSGVGFVEGKYLLRCVGLNSSHQPVVYADRDFNVLRSDLTTGTALPTTYGDLTFTQYDKTDANPPANPRYSIDVELQFLPKTTVPCNNVAFMQSMQTIDAQGRSQQNTVNVEQDARQTPLAWSIDRVAGAPSPFYIAGRDPRTRRVVDVPGWGRAGRGGARPREATLIDQPSWDQPNNAKFESCVVCRSGANRGQVYGCATWGYTADAAGKVTLMPRGFRPMPSDQFEEARAAWNTWRATVPVARRPQEAPALRSP